jgi:hypothetical protein
MKHRIRIVAALVVALLLLAIPMASATGPNPPHKVNVGRYGLCASVSPKLTICY